MVLLLTVGGLVQSLAGVDHALVAGLVLGLVAARLTPNARRA
ncbi:MAG: hypothetical protein ACON4Z_07840 [Planctomycetota bacterium]